MVKLRIEPAEHVEHLARLTNGLPDVAECVGKRLEATAVLVDADVAMVEVMVLSLKINGAVEVVVAVLIRDGMPDGEDGRAWATDDIEDVWGDGVADSIQDALFNHPPFGVVAQVGVPGGSKTKHAHDAVEEGVPLGVVRSSDV